MPQPPCPRSGLRRDHRSSTSWSCRSLQLTQKPLRQLDVLGLTAFVTTTKQKNHRLAPLPEINPITAAMMDTQLADAFAYRRGVSRMSIRQAVQPRRDQCPRPFVLERRPPLVKHI